MQDRKKSAKCEKLENQLLPHLLLITTYLCSLTENQRKQKIKRKELNNTLKMGTGWHDGKCQIYSAVRLPPKIASLGHPASGCPLSRRYKNSAGQRYLMYRWSKQTQMSGKKSSLKMKVLAFA